LQAAWHRPPLTLRLLPDEVIAAMWTRATRGVLDSVAAGDFLCADELRGLRVPARIVWGEADRLLPPGSLDFFRSALPQADVALLPQCGHVPHLEAPRALARALLKPLPPAA
ncbi:MAG TPA: alpha/beta fold hydrolase, partial [Myxococcales bacterium]|nr:alpha/beta fold hydrolase [Myxococcales bacterium]